MGIFRPNKLGYTSDDVEKKSNSYIMTLVEKFVTNITDIVNSFKKDINTAVEVQNNEIDGISERLNQEIVQRDNEDNSLKKDVQDLNSELFNLDGKYENITDKIIDDLDTERLQREGVNTGHDKQISDLYAKKADKIAVELKADKATTLSGYGITDAYNKTEVNDKLLAIDGRYKTAEYSDIDSLYEPCIYHIADNDKHNGWLLVTHYTEEYEDHHYGSMIGNAFCQLYFHENDNYEGVLEKRTGTNGRWTEWESIGNGSVDLSNVSDEAFLDKLNAVLPDGDEVSY